MTTIPFLTQPQETIIVYSPATFHYNNCQLRVINLENNPGWVLEDVANLFEVLISGINQELEQSPWINWHSRVILAEGNTKEVSVLPDDLFWYLLFTGVGLNKNYTTERRQQIKLWLFTKVVPVLVHLDFYGSQPVPDFSLVSSQFLEDYKQQFLNKISYLEQTNQELFSYLQRLTEAHKVLLATQSKLQELEEKSLVSSQSFCNHQAEFLFNIKGLEKTLQQLINYLIEQNEVKKLFPEIQNSLQAIERQQNLILETLQAEEKTSVTGKNIIASCFNLKNWLKQFRFPDNHE